MTIFAKRIFALILLFGGIAILAYGLYSSYEIFTAKTEPPVIFEIPEQTSVSPKGTSGDLQGQLQGLLGEQLKGIMPADYGAKFFNLISWSVFAGILMLGGGQIAGLGVKLLR